MSGVKSGVLCHSCSVLLCTRGALKVTSCLTDVLQQLFEQQDITVIVLCTIHFHHWLHENHTSVPAPGDTDWNRSAGTCLSETSEVCPWAEMASDWNMVSNQQSFIDKVIDQCWDCFIACFKAKSKHYEHLLWCVSLWYVTVMTFKAYTTAVMNKLTYVFGPDLCFVSQGRVRTAVRRCGQFCRSFVANLLKYMWPKIMKILWGLTKLLQDNKGAFFALQCNIKAHFCFDPAVARKVLL